MPKNIYMRTHRVRIARSAQVRGLAERVRESKCSFIKSKPRKNWNYKKLFKKRVRMPTERNGTGQKNRYVAEKKNRVAVEESGSWTKSKRNESYCTEKRERARWKIDCTLTFGKAERKRKEDRTNKTFFLCFFLPWVFLCIFFLVVFSFGSSPSFPPFFTLFFFGFIYIYIYKRKTGSYMF